MYQSSPLADFLIFEFHYDISTRWVLVLGGPLDISFLTQHSRQRTFPPQQRHACSAIISSSAIERQSFSVSSHLFVLPSLPLISCQADRPLKRVRLRH